MSYRKITVKGKVYEYVIGKSHLKIKAFGLYPNSTIGNRVQGTNSYIVTPGIVARVISGEQLPVMLHCSKHVVSTVEMMADPFATEVHRKTIYMPACDACANQLAGDI